MSVDTSSDDEFNFPFPVDESYMSMYGNITCFYWPSIHEKSVEIPSEAQVPTLSMEIHKKERSRWVDVWANHVETEVCREVETFSYELRYFLQVEMCKSRLTEMVSYMNIHLDCLESVALKITDIANKAHEVGKKMVHVVTEFKVLNVFQEEDEEDEEDEEETLAHVLRESVDLADQRTAGAVPASRFSVEALKRMTFNKGDNKEIKCTICLNEFSTGMEVIRMPCSHIFDVECIIQWLEINHVCPLCRFEMPQQSEEI
ncbi:uncharacterized protein LOC131234637 [Magnolia sinica]|uniref:uncharacterized protein LOC131234637 n=1 Tax=Magnolia sinica TaxID=86752 RepID=UPI00265A255A|nr:uncharacterized protein LOC131234637 [Magnolia sinica]